MTTGTPLKKNYMRTDLDAPKKNQKKLCENRCSEKQQKKQYENRLMATKNPDNTI